MRHAGPLFALLCLLPAPAVADAIDGPNIRCPSGTTPSSDHSGSYCRPEPPESCPAGYVPRVFRDQAYCEPPPSTPCPPGSDWGTSGPDDRGRCFPLAQCSGGAACQPGQTCRRVGLCLAYQASGPRMIAYVHGVCDAEGPCGPEGATCSLDERCDPDVRRVDPEGRTLPSIPVPRASGCGCRAAGLGSSPHHLAPVLLALLALVRRRR